MRYSFKLKARLRDVLLELRVRLQQATLKPRVLNQLHLLADRKVYGLGRKRGSSVETKPHRKMWNEFFTQTECARVVIVYDIYIMSVVCQDLTPGSV